MNNTLSDEELKYCLITLKNIREYLLNNENYKTNNNIRNLIDKIFMSKNYNNNKIFSNLLNKELSKYIFDEKSFFNTKYNNEIVKELNINGFHILNEKLHSYKINNILNQLNNKEFNNHEQKKVIKISDINNPPLGRFMIKNQSDVLNIKEVQDLVTDPLILNICQEYLEAPPILIQTNFWVTNGEETGYGDNTTKFHQDFDDIRFIKIFIYLSDVNEDNGPHSYVKGSINNIIVPNNYKKYKRLSDEEIKSNYGEENVLSFKGEKGTIIFENTYGFHKGTNLKKGKRFMLQLQYAATTFFSTEKGLSPINIKNEKIRNFKEKYPNCGLFLIN